MEINTMITKFDKLLAKANRLETRIKKDTDSLQKTNKELEQLKKDLLQSADLMAKILDMNPEDVRNKILQQVAMEPSIEAASPPASKKTEKKSLQIKSAVAVQTPTVEPETEPRSYETEEHQEKSISAELNGLKIDPFDTIL